MGPARQFVDRLILRMYEVLTRDSPGRATSATKATRPPGQLFLAMPMLVMATTTHRYNLILCDYLRDGLSTVMGKLLRLGFLCQTTCSTSPMRKTQGVCDAVTTCGSPPESEQTRNLSGFGVLGLIVSREPPSLWKCWNPALFAGFPSAGGTVEKSG